MQTLPYYYASVNDLVAALDRIEAVNAKFPQYRTAVRQLRKNIKQLEAATKKRERALGVD